MRVHTPECQEDIAHGEAKTRQDSVPLGSWQTQSFHSARPQSHLFQFPIHCFPTKTSRCTLEHIMPQHTFSVVYMDERSVKGISSSRLSDFLCLLSKHSPLGHGQILLHLPHLPVTIGLHKSTTSHPPESCDSHPGKNFRPPNKGN